MLSNRLQQLANYLEDPICFADIGSDHAYLPCYVCVQHPKAKAIAGELNEGPYQRAKQTVLDQHLAAQIDVRKGNGLEVISPGEVNQITIAGMGGKLICSILNNGKNKLSGVQRLILQPNIDAHLVRKWVIDNSYRITAEAIILEEGYVYEIIVCDFYTKQQKLNNQQLLFGPFLLEEKTDVFQQKWLSEKNKTT
ncbi:tRNA-m1A22 methylase [Gracilibacillus boraciitolerans JCM 21714]|uniref:tRNA-m1A22 methylase n=1 Tax=Gracilibacillus boraciitolerans JCM 21714 TaxID=1298598 RepID=W4VEJ3_9BACI|nr:tRNA-m1A22 methylase [Gracilibacillus boraciitolerans JCM 21714]